VRGTSLSHDQSGREADSTPWTSLVRSRRRSGSFPCDCSRVSVAQPAQQANTAQPVAQTARTVPPHRQDQQSSAITDIVKRMRAPLFQPGPRPLRPCPPPPWPSACPSLRNASRGKTDRLIMDADQSGVRTIEATEQFVRGPGHPRQARSGREHGTKRHAGRDEGDAAQQTLHQPPHRVRQSLSARSNLVERL